MHGNVQMTPLDAWRAEVRVLEDAYRSVCHEGPHEMAAFQAYMDGCRAAFGRLSEADPDTAGRLFAENMLKVSSLSW